MEGVAAKVASMAIKEDELPPISVKELASNIRIVRLEDK